MDSQLTRRWMTAGLTLALSFLAVEATQASTVGSWRFEDGAFMENEVSGQDASTVGTAPMQTTLSSTGAGSNFPNPIPFSGATNGSAASFDGGNLSTDIAGSDFTSGSLTIEALFNVNDASGSSEMIAAIWGSSNDNRTFFLAVSSGRIRVGYADQGGNVGATNASNLVVQSNTDYYTALTMTSGGEVRAYLKDLTNDGPLQSHGNLFGGLVGGVLAPSEAMGIGGTAGGSNRFTGLIDEVRVTNGVIDVETQGMLVPEPASLALGGLGGMMLLFRRRREAV